MDELIKPHVAHALLTDANADYLRDLFASETPANTRRAYTQAASYFRSWFQARYEAEEHPDLPISISVVLDFIQDHDPEHGMDPPVTARLNELWRGSSATAGTQIAWSTFQQRLSVISKIHDVAGLESPARAPAVRQVLSRIKRRYAKQRKLGTRTPHLSIEDLHMLERMIGAEVRAGTPAAQKKGARDLALLLVGFASGGRRRSELAGLDMADLTRADGGNYLWRIGLNKTDQVGEDKFVPINGTAAAALDDWLALSGIESGPVFRRITRTGAVAGGALNPSSLYRILKGRFKSLTLDHLSPHSIRAGFVTAIGRRSINPHDGMAMSLHSSYDSFMRYYRPAQANLNPAAGIYDEPEDSAGS